MKLIPYLNFAGNAEEALNFYNDALGGEVTVMRYEGSPMESQVPEHFKSKLMHGRIESDAFSLMVSDVVPQHAPKIGNNIKVNIDFTSEDTQQEVFDKMASGGNVTMPLADQFWGARFGMLTDKFGIDWMFNCNKSG